MNKKIIIIVVCLLLIFIATRNSFYKPNETQKDQNLPSSTVESSKQVLDGQMILNLGGVKINTEVVKSQEDLARGLSFREGLEKDAGMLFVFESLGYWGFWMKDMKFSIDIIWLDENFSVVHIEKKVAPETFPNSFEPNALSKYVLEVNAGFVDENKIEIGSRVTLSQ